MFDIEIVNANGLAVRIAADAIPVTPRGAEARLERVAAEAVPVIFSLFERTLAQAPKGTSAPILLVAAPDAALGRHLIAQHHGPGLIEQLCGPVVIPIQPHVFVQAFGGQQALASLKALDPKAGEIVVAFAVNGSGLDVRKIRPAATIEEPTTDETKEPTDETIGRFNGTGAANGAQA